ncbi:MAG: hypothetical protein RLZZ241_2444 [Bacteroidota bacterium]|jgi:uncharacterized YigZ family protein
MPSFKSIAAPCGPVIYKERKSKFIGFGFNVNEVSAVKSVLESLRSRYPDAAHICYAYKIGLQNPEIRMNDDGEPSYSAGAPIYGQIEAFDLENILICVVRYFGGTKLGVGGLIQAYRETARMCLETAEISQIQPMLKLVLEFEYNNIDSVMRILAQHQLELANQTMNLSCSITIRVAESEFKEICALFQTIKDIKISSSKL